MNTKRYNLSYIPLLCPHPELKVASRRPRKCPRYEKVLRFYKFPTTHNDPQKVMFLKHNGTGMSDNGRVKNNGKSDNEITSTFTFRTNISRLMLKANIYHTCYYTTPILQHLLKYRTHITIPLNITHPTIYHTYINYVLNIFII